MRALLLCLALAGCASAPPTPAPAPIPGAESGEQCPAACVRRRALGCLEERLSDACVPVCERAAAAGFYSPACVVRAYSRDELAACRVRCTP